MIQEVFLMTRRKIKTANHLKNNFYGIEFIGSSLRATLKTLTYKHISVKKQSGPLKTQLFINKSASAQILFVNGIISCASQRST